MAEKLSGGKATNLKKENYFDFGELYAKYKRYWWLFVLCFVGCMGLAIFYLIVKAPVYGLESTIVISSNSEGSGSVGANLVKNLSIGGSGSGVDDEILVVNSVTITRDMVRELGLNCAFVEHRGFLKNIDLYDCCPIRVMAPEALFDTLQYTLKFRIKIAEDGSVGIKVKKGLFKTLANLKTESFPVTVTTDYGIYVVDTTEYYVPGVELDIKGVVSGYQPVAEDYAEEIDGLIISKRSNGIQLLYDDTNVKRGKDVLNKIVELYNRRCQRIKDETAINTGRFIDERLGIIYNDLAGSEEDIEKYKRDKGLAHVSTDVAMMYSHKSTGDASSLSLTTSYEVLKMAKDFVDDPANKYSMIPVSVGSSEAGGMVDMYNNLVLERNRVARSAKENSLVLKNVDDRLDVVRENLIRAIDKSLETLEIRLKASQNLENQASSQLVEVPSQERELKELYRQQSIKNELYTYLLQKREENALVLAATTPRGQVVDEAFAYSEPVKPRKGLILFIGFFMGIVLPILLLYIKNLLTTRFALQDELEQIIDAPVLGEVCHNRHHSALVVRQGRTSSIVELFRLLRNNVQFMLPKETGNVILVTSSIAGEGKTFIALNVAASFALLGKRVALVGMDIRSPKLSEYLNVKPSPGVTTFLAKHETVVDTVIQHCDEVNGLDIVVGGPIPPNPSELLQTSRTREFIESLREKYDYVIIDSAPIAMVSDTFSLTPYVDFVLYVTRANYTKRSLIKYFNTVLSRGQIRNAGAIINDTNPKFSQGYGYGYGSKED